MSSGVGCTQVPRIMVFRPTMEEFSDFAEYIKTMEKQGAHKAGLAKVIPPKEWIPRKNGYDDINRVVISAPISQMVSGRGGLYQQFNIQKRSMTVGEFEKMANSDKFNTPAHFDYDDLERKYWKNVSYNPPIYGADVSGSLYDHGVEHWNINHLNTILDCVSGDYGIKIEGVNTAYLYFGMWKTSFAWHTEDMDLYSINYLHFGAPKSWYAIPPEHGRRLERMANGFFADSHSECSAFLRHKMTIISPQILKKFSIPYNKITQEPGEFMITFPYGYHAGYNHGYNCAESTNFATERWVEYGKRASQCTCRKDCVKISMETFVKRYQPDRYELWKIGKDIGPHPEDPSRLTAANPPTRAELVMNNRSTEKKRRVVGPGMGAMAKRHYINDVDDDACSDNNNGIKTEDGYDVLEGQVTVKLEPLDSTAVKQEPQFQMDVDETREQEQQLDQSPNDVHQKYAAPSFGAMTKGRPPVKSAKKGDKYHDQLSAAAKLQRQREAEQASLQIRELNMIMGQQPGVTPGQSSSPFTVKREPEDPVPLPVTVQKLADRLAAPQLESSSSDNHGALYPKLQTSTNFSVSLLKQPATAASKETSYRVVASSDETAPLLTVIKTEIASPSSTSAASSFSSYSPSRSLLRHPGDAASVGLPAASNSPVASIDNRWSDTAPPTLQEHTSTAYRPTNRHADLSPPDLGPPQLPPLLESQSSSSVVTENVWTRAFASPATGGAQIASRAEPACGSSRSTTSPNYPPPPKLSPQVPVGAVESSSANYLSQAQRVQIPNLPDATASNGGGESGSAKHRSIPKQTKVKKTAIRRHPICQPLDSDDDSSCYSKAEAQTTWMKSVTDLWHFKKPNFDAEMSYNERCGSLFPHCSVCQLFREPWKPSDSDKSETRMSIPASSKVLMADMAFAGTDSGPSMSVRQCTAIGVSEDGTSPLMVCQDCKVCVHASCYGVEKMLDAGQLWRCARCVGQSTEAECCLCFLRGGALKPTSDGTWAHIVCATAMPDVYFGDSNLRDPVVTASLSKERLNLRCVYCKAMMKRANQYGGACIQCSVGNCKTAFHVTCAHAAGRPFKNGDWPHLIHVVCARHPDKTQQPNVCDVEVGEQVTARNNRTRRYYNATIIHREDTVTYDVYFEDGSTCSALCPSDVKSHDCAKNGPPAIDESIRVKWIDGKMYDAVYRGQTIKTEYQVLFEDNSKQYVLRSDFYAKGEKIPAKIRSRMSTATEMRHEDMFYKTLPVSGKRKRVVNKKFVSDDEASDSRE